MILFIFGGQVHELTTSASMLYLLTLPQSFRHVRTINYAVEQLGPKLDYTDGFFDVLSRVLRPVSEEQYAEAAVAVLLKPENKDLKVLLVKRVESQTDP
jgi:hypothetical protein